MIFPDITGAPPRPAAAAIVMRGASPMEILLARRNTALRFMGGHHVFPGGAIDEDDDPAIVAGPDAESNARAIAAAARELFEETGLLAAEGSVPSPEALREARRALVAGEARFAELLHAFNMRLDPKRFIPAGIWITPPISPKRYHTQYFLVPWDRPETGEVLASDGEIVGLDWFSPAESRRQWRAGSIKLSTPVAFVLQHLEALPLDAALPWLHKTPSENYAIPMRFELRHGVHLIPLRTDTLPPATHTNCLVLGDRELYIVDPGAHDEDECLHLKEHLDRFLALGARIAAVLLTHGHPDHHGSAAFLREAYGIPIWAHQDTAAPAGLPVARALQHGDIIDIPGDPPWSLRCLHTPGHDPGHLCFLEASTGTLLCGDMFANPGTIVVSPEFGGDMTRYLESLERLLEEDFAFLIPAHGMPLGGPKAKDALRDLIAHRLKREARIRAAIDNGAASIDDILAHAYDDTPRDVWPIARHQLAAHLIRLGVDMR